MIIFLVKSSQKNVPAACTVTVIAQPLNGYIGHWQGECIFGRKAVCSPPYRSLDDRRVWCHVAMQCCCTSTEYGKNLKKQPCAHCPAMYMSLVSSREVTGIDSLPLYSKWHDICTHQGTAIGEKLASIWKVDVIHALHYNKIGQVSAKLILSVHSNMQTQICC